MSATVGTLWRASRSLACSELASYYARRRGLRLTVSVKNRIYGDCVYATIERREPPHDAVRELAFRKWDGVLHTTIATAQAWCEGEADRLATVARVERVAAAVAREARMEIRDA